MYGVRNKRTIMPVSCETLLPAYISFTWIERQCASNAKPNDGENRPHKARSLSADESCVCLSNQNGPFLCTDFVRYQPAFVASSYVPPSRLRSRPSRLRQSQWHRIRSCSFSNDLENPNEVPTANESNFIASPCFCCLIKRILDWLPFSSNSLCLVGIDYLSDFAALNVYHPVGGRPFCLFLCVSIDSSVWPLEREVRKCQPRAKESIECCKIDTSRVLVSYDGGWNTIFYSAAGERSHRCFGFSFTCQGKTISI